MTLSCDASGNPTPTFSWTIGGADVNTNANPRISLSSDNKQLTITKVNRSDSGYYQCVANNSIGAAVTSNAATLDVQCKTNGLYVLCYQYRDYFRKRLFSVLCTLMFLQGCDNYREVQRIYGSKLACSATKGV